MPKKPTLIAAGYVIQWAGPNGDAVEEDCLDLLDAKSRAKKGDWLGRKPAIYQVFHKKVNYNPKRKGG